MTRREELTDEQWALVARFVASEPAATGRPRVDDRAALNGVLWVLRSGARWKDLPERFPSYQTCHRRFQAWVESRALRAVLETLAEDLRQRGGIDLTEGFVDATFALAKKGDLPSARPSGARVRSSWQWQTALVFLSPCTWQVLARMKSPLSRRLSRPPSSMSFPLGLWAIGPTTAMGSTRGLPPSAASS